VLLRASAALQSVLALTGRQAGWLILKQLLFIYDQMFQLVYLFVFLLYKLQANAVGVCSGWQPLLFWVKIVRNGRYWL
jgi:hypothetical protein